MDHPLPNNLPNRARPELVGRKGDIQQILSLLAEDRPDFLIRVEGIGGIGKSTLVCEIAWRIVDSDLRVPENVRFNAVIYMTAQQKELTSLKITQSPAASTNLDGICNAIADVLQYDAIKSADTLLRPFVARKAMEEKGPILLIVDNLEDVTDNQVFEFLWELPRGSKALLTTREHRGGQQPLLGGAAVFRHHARVRLHPLDDDEMGGIIGQERANFGLVLDTTHVDWLIQLAKGVPLAAIVPLRYANAYGVGEAFSVFNDLHHPDNEVLYYIFHEVITRVKHDLEDTQHIIYHALLSLAFFDVQAGAASLAVARTVRCEPARCKEALEKLYALCLVNRDGPNADVYRYSLLSFTREYLIDHIIEGERAWEQEARERWVAYYRGFAANNGGLDWAAWAAGYRQLDVEWRNLKQVFEWCMSAQHYDDLIRLWNDDHVREFANVVGWWYDRKQWLRSVISVLKPSTEDQARSAVLMDYLAALAYTLAHQGGSAHLDDAQNKLDEAWRLGEVSDFEAQQNMTGIRARHETAINYVLLFIHRKKFDDAEFWLNRYREILEHSGLTGREYKRRYIEILYYQGRIHFDQRQYPAAQLCFKDMKQGGEDIHYDRAVIFALNYLADIAREEGDLLYGKAAQEPDPKEARRLKANAKKNFDRAAEYLREGEDKTECEMDRRRYAYYKRSHAYLECSRGRPAIAKEFAIAALDLFTRQERLAMQPDDIAKLERLADGECPQRDGRKS